MLTWLTFGGTATIPADLAGQLPTVGDVTVTGVVTDSTTGEPLQGALLTIGDRGLQAITDAEGRFVRVGVPVGTHTLTVRRLGFHVLTTVAVVSEGMPRLEIELTPDPVRLDGLTITGDARADFGGIVVHAVTGEPVPWTDLMLTSDGVDRVGRRTASDLVGEFSIGNVRAGTYLLRVERLGYQSQYLPVDHGVPPLQTVVRLAPDSTVLRGLAEMNRVIETRRRAHARAGIWFGEDRLRLAVARGMKDFFDAYSSIPVLACGPGPARGNCSKIFINELPTDLAMLDMYQPSDFYSIEVFDCGRTEVHAFTYDFMERTARDPRILHPQCLP